MASGDGGSVNMTNMPFKPPLKTWRGRPCLGRSQLFQKMRDLEGIPSIDSPPNEDFRNITSLLISYTFVSCFDCKNVHNSYTNVVLVVWIIWKGTLVVWIIWKGTLTTCFLVLVLFVRGT